MHAGDHTLVQIPTVRTERFVLRAPRRSDLDAYTAFRTSDRAKGIGGPFPAFDTHAKLCSLVGHWLIEGFGRWIVADKDDAPLGVVGFYYPDGWPEPEIAWSVFEHAEGQGVAYEAAVATRAYAYDVLNWKTVMSCISPDNSRSLALARRMGAVFERSFTHSVEGELQIWRHLPPEALT
ncbi:N-acetyltransferase [Roseobacter denitrificans]|nr:N-acetyltransferase [Roseobacter denitrificans]